MSMPLEDQIKNLIQSQFPYSKDGFTLKLTDLEIKYPQGYNTIQYEYALKNASGDLDASLVGTFTLVGPDGKEMGRRANRELIKIPIKSLRGTYIVKGNERVVSNQLQSKQGAYTSVSAGVVKTQITFPNRMLPTFDIILAPEASKMVISANKKNFPAVDFLTFVGCDNNQIRYAFGNDDFANRVIANGNKGGKATMRELFSETVLRSNPKAKFPDSADLATALIQNALTENGKMDQDTKDVFEMTMGQKVDNFDERLLLELVKKTMNIARGKQEEDNRDDLIFQTAYSGEDTLVELVKEAIPDIMKIAEEAIDSKKVSATTKVSDVLGWKLNRFLSRAELSEQVEETNPLHLEMSKRKFTISGEGGLSGDTLRNAISAKNLKPTAINRFDPVHTPESGKIGTINYLTQDAQVDSVNKTINTTFYRVQNGAIRKEEGNTVALTPKEEYGAYVAFNDPKYLTSNGSMMTLRVGKVPGRYQGKVGEYESGKIQFIDKNPQNIFGLAANLVPFAHHNDGGRMLMGANMQTQALELKHREEPMVQVLKEKGSTKTYEEEAGDKSFTVKSPVSGTVIDVKPDKISVKDENGAKHDIEIYDYFPLNAGHLINNDPVVKPGDMVKAGDLLAEGWSTKNGKLALGVNARIGYLSFKGHNFEDGIVISESFANKASVDEPYSREVAIMENMIGGPGSDIKALIQRETGIQASLTNLDANGIIKPGSEVKAGDVLIARMKESTRELSEEAQLINKLTGVKQQMVDCSEYIADSSYTKGKVLKVEPMPPQAGEVARYKILISSTTSLKVGDKISGRHGNKGTITLILPDKEMPKTEDGKGLDVLQSPLAIPSRKNLGQLFEVNAGLLAEKTGVPFKALNFDTESEAAVAKGLKDIGIEDGKLAVIDPDSGTPYENKITVGNMYMMKLKHKADEKIQARSFKGKAPNFVYMEPSKVSGDPAGEKRNPQRLGEMEMWALQGHKAVNNILESTTLKGDGAGDIATRAMIFRALSGEKNIDDLSELSGMPESFNILRNSLTAMGIQTNMTNSGRAVKDISKKPFDEITINPAKDKDLLNFIGAGNQVTKSSSFKTRAGGDEVEGGGLFDEGIFGTYNNEDAASDRNKWGYIKLPHPVPNPMLLRNKSFNPYSMLTPFSNDQVREIMERDVVVITASNGTPFKEGEIVASSKIEAYENSADMETPLPMYKAGGDALMHYMDQVDVDKDLESTTERLKNSKASERDQLYRRYRLLSNMKKNGIKPEDYMTKVIPVVPTFMRPRMENPDGSVISEDLNKLYANIIYTSNKYENTLGRPEFMTASQLGKDSSYLYKAVSDLYGATTAKDRKTGAELRGIKERLEGKEGLIHKRSLGKRVDYSGRSVIGVDPDLKLDEVAIPIDMAMSLYEPFIVKELYNGGYASNYKEAAKMAKQPEMVKKVIDKAVNDRPVMINRAPSLHKLSFQAFTPIVKDYDNTGRPIRTMQLNPLVVTPFNADFDGDSSVNSILSRKKIINTKENLGYTDGINSIESENNMPFTENIRYSYGVVNLKDFPRTNLIESKGNTELYEVPGDVEVLTVWNGKKQWLPVESYSVHKNLSMCEIETNTSRTIQCSDDHSLVSIDENLQYLRCKAKVGMTIPRLREIVSSDENISLMNEYTINALDEAKYELVSESIPLDIKFGYLNGVYIGDGWISNSKNRSQYAVCLASVYKDLVSEITEIMKVYLGDKFVMGKTGSAHEFDGFPSYSEKHTWASKTFWNYFKENIGEGAENKHLPPFWMTSAEQFRWGLLSGLIDTDGSVCLSNDREVTVSYTTKSRTLSYEIVALAHTLNLTASVCITETPKREAFYAVVFTQESIEMMQTKILLNTPHKKKVLSSFKPRKDYKRNKYTPKLSVHRLDELRKLVGSPELKNSKGELKFEGDELIKAKQKKSIYAVLYKVGKQDTAVTRPTALNILALNLDIFETDMFWAKWKEMVLDESIEWEMITSIKALPFITEAYDLTIPPAFTMVTESGIVIYDTMGVHVPLTAAAAKEAKELMMPSSNLTNPRNGMLVPEFKNEMVLGIYYLMLNSDKPTSKKKVVFTSHKDIYDQYVARKVGPYDMGSYKGVDATVGQLLVNFLIPDKYAQYRQFGKVMGKGDIERLLTRMHSDPNVSDADLVATLERLKKLGFMASTKSGLSIGLGDFKKPEGLDKRLDEIAAELGSDTEADSSKLIANYMTLQDEVEKAYKKGEVLDKNNPVQIMMASGARGNAGQIRRMSATVGVGRDIALKLTLPVRNSHLDGLAPQEFWTHSFDARKGLYDRSVSTSDPGALTKEVMGANQDVIVTTKDCGTTNGIDIIKTDRTLVGRHIAKALPLNGGKVILKRGTFITNNLFDQIGKDNGVTHVKVRSVMTCKATDGVCQMCYGAMPGTKSAVQIGEPVGVIATQSLGEPVTQMTMKTFHTGGLNSSVTLGLPRVKEILSSKDKLKNMAVLAKSSGVAIISHENGSTVVTIGGIKHIIPDNPDGTPKSLRIHNGDAVRAGDFLTKGNSEDLGKDEDDITFASPIGILKARGNTEEGFRDVQNYLSDSLDYAFRKTIGGGQIDRRHIEVTVNQMTGNVDVLDGGDSPFMPGHSMKRNEADKWNADNANGFKTKTVSLNQPGNCLGRASAESVVVPKINLKLTPGDIITQETIGLLLASGRKDIKVKPKPISYDYHIGSLTSSAKDGNENWVSNLGLHNMGTNLSRAMTYGQVDKMNTVRSRQIAGKMVPIGPGFNLLHDAKEKANSMANSLMNMFS